MCLCILIFALLIGLLIRKAGKRMRKLSILVQNTMGDVNHVVQETVSGNVIVKGFGGQPAEQERFKKHSLENLRRGLKMTAIAQYMTQLMTLTTSAITRSEQIAQSNHLNLDHISAITNSSNIQYQSVENLDEAIHSLNGTADHLNDLLTQLKQ